MQKMKSTAHHKKSNLATALLLISICILASCSGTVEHKLNFNPEESIRVAVMPFARVNEEGKVITEDPSIIIDGVPLVSEELEDDPADIVRQMVVSELRKSSLDIVSTSLIDLELPHHGFKLMNREQILEMSPDRICSHLLDCDAIITGKITKWKRSYYGLQSINSVGIELKMTSLDKKTLYSVKAEDSDSRGLSKGPTGYSSLVVEPIKGLDSQIIEDLARKVVRDALKPLRTSSRSDFLTSEPPSIFATSHSSRSGKIKRGEPLIVLMFASPKQNASFSIGKIIENTIPSKQTCSPTRIFLFT